MHDYSKFGKQAKPGLFTAFPEEDAKSELEALRCRVVELEDFILNLGEFANGEGDVGNLIARRCHKILNPDPTTE